MDSPKPILSPRTPVGQRAHHIPPYPQTSRFPTYNRGRGTPRSRLYSRNGDRQSEEMSTDIYSHSRSEQSHENEGLSESSCSSNSSELILWDCPLCMEEVDITDADFTPCECGYQICRFCWNHIKTVLNDSCPACRRAYSEQVEYGERRSDQCRQERELRKSRKEKEPSRAMLPVFNSKAAPANNTSRGGAPIGSILPSRKHLVDIRVLQPNLVYVIGIPLSLECYVGYEGIVYPSVNSTAGIVSTLEMLLASEEYFGRYGNIIKLVINVKGQHLATPSKPVVLTKNIVATTVSAFLTFSHKGEASKAIESIDGTDIGGFPLRATYGTTKYCAYFLRGTICPNITTCLYLHDVGEDGNSYTKETLSARQRDSQLKKTLDNGVEIITHTLAAPKKKLSDEVIDCGPHGADVNSNVFRPIAISTEMASSQGMMSKSRSTVTVGSGKNSPLPSASFDPLHPSNDIPLSADRSSSRFEFANGTVDSLSLFREYTDDLNVSNLLDSYHSTFRKSDEPPVICEAVKRTSLSLQTQTEPPSGIVFEATLMFGPGLLTPEVSPEPYIFSKLKTKPSEPKIEVPKPKSLDVRPTTKTPEPKMWIAKPTDFRPVAKGFTEVPDVKKTKEKPRENIEEVIVKPVKKAPAPPKVPTPSNPFALLLEDDSVDEMESQIEVLPAIDFSDIKAKKKKSKKSKKVQEQKIDSRGDPKQSFGDASRPEESLDGIQWSSVDKSPSSTAEIASILSNSYCSDDDDQLIDMSFYGPEDAYYTDDDDSEYEDLEEQFSHFQFDDVTNCSEEYLHDLEMQLARAQEETRFIEKRLIAVMQRNRKLVFVD